MGDSPASKRAREEFSGPDFTALQRIVLSSNGNLGVVLSSYHNAAVSVKPRYSRSANRGLIEREVEFSVHGTVFGVATSTISLLHANLIAAFEERGLNIGQLFRDLNVMPSFELRDAGHLVPGRLADGDLEVPRFYREYTLSGEGVSCQIREVFRADLFKLHPSAGSVPCAAKGAACGDIIPTNYSFLPLPDDFTPLQRLLLTANGNLERILSSYFARPLQLYVSLNHKRVASVFDRQAALLYEGRQLMLAKTTIFITDPTWQAAVENGADLTSLFRRFSELPTFTLHDTGKGPGFFWRQYSLKASGMTCQINETFPDDIFDDAAPTAFAQVESAIDGHFGGF